MSPIDHILQSKQAPKAKMPIWARFSIFSAGAFATTVAVISELALESMGLGDHLRAFFGMWFGPLSIVGSIVGPWVRSSLMS